MNWILVLLVLCAYLVTSWQQFNFTAVSPENISPMQQMNLVMLDSASGAITLAISLIGVMMLFLGLIKILEQGGALNFLAKLLYPIFRPLFPEIPPEHPAIGAMMMNLSANILGLGNAATPFGIRAMQALNQLNTQPGTATNAMVLFLVINTTCVTVLPTKIIAMRAAAGSLNPASVIPTILTASLIATISAIFITKFLQRFFPVSNSSPVLPIPTLKPKIAYPVWSSYLAIVGLISLIPLSIFYGQIFSPWVIPSLVLVILIFGMIKKIKIYEVFVDGAKEGLDVAIKIMPYLVAILLAVGMFKQSGALDFITNFLGKYTGLVGLPAEALPMALLRPFSGSGSFGILAAVLNDPLIGPDSYVGVLVSTLMGTTETSFYVLAVYFGAIQIKRFRHAVLAAILADLVGVISAVVIVKIIY